MPKRADPTGFAGRLKELRAAAGLTQKELAERANLYQSSLAKLEQGEREPVWATVLALADALGVRPNDFLAEGPAPARPGPKGRPRKAGVPEPGKVAELLGDLNAASHRARDAHLQRRGTRAALEAKRRAVDQLFLLVFGRKASEDEYAAATTDAIGYG